MRHLPAYVADADGRPHAATVVELDESAAVVRTELVLEPGTRVVVHVGVTDELGTLDLPATVTGPPDGGRVTLGLHKPTPEALVRLEALAEADPGAPAVDAGGAVVWPVEGTPEPPTAIPEDGLQRWDGSAWTPAGDGPASPAMGGAEADEYAERVRALVSAGEDAILAYRGRLLAPPAGIPGDALLGEGSALLDGVTAQMEILDDLDWLGPPLDDPQFLPLESLAEAHSALPPKLEALRVQAESAGEDDPVGVCAETMAAYLRGVRAQVEQVLHSARAAVALAEDRRRRERDEEPYEAALSVEAQEKERERARQEAEERKRRQAEKAARKAERQAEAEAKARASAKKASPAKAAKPVKAAKAAKAAPAGSGKKKGKEKKKLSEYGGKEWMVVAGLFLVFLIAVSWGGKRAQEKSLPPLEERFLPDHLQEPFELQRSLVEDPSLVAILVAESPDEGTTHYLVSEFCWHVPAHGYPTIEIRGPDGAVVARCKGQSPIWP